MKTSIATLAALSGAHLSPYSATTITGISTDTRTLRPGELFMALRGEYHDGHDHVAAALEAGAAALLVDRDIGFDTPVPVLRVSDTRQALIRLAAGWRQRHRLPGIAVCGSNGKTTVKDMLASILRHAFGTTDVLSTCENHNNAIGVATTLMELETHHRAFVLELGTNHPGEIVELAGMVRPSIALINNAQREHQEFFGDIDSVAIENAGVLALLARDGIAVFPVDSPYTAVWREIAGNRHCLTFGEHENADVRLTDFAGDGRCMRIQLTGIPELPTVLLQVPGRHNALNALAAATCAHALGLDAHAIRHGLEACSGTQGRLTFNHLPDKRVLIDDTYNANPDSVRAAIDVLVSLPGPRWLVLGDMGECGDNAPRFHAEIGGYARERGVDRLFTVGTDSRHSAEAFGPEAHWTMNLADLQATLVMPPAGATVLVKGSRFMRMERIVSQLQETFAG